MTRAQPRDNPIDGDCFVIGEVAEFCVSLPCEVYAGCVIERASHDAQTFLSDLIGSLLFLNANPFEMERDAETKRTTRLSQDEWRYSILRRVNDYIPVSVLKSAALIEPNIYLGPHFYKLNGQTGIGSSPGIQNHYWSPHRWWNSGKQVTPDTISQWRETASRLENVESTHPEIGRSVHMFWILSGNDPTVDRLTVLGYFIVIESLLTHRPDPKDPTASIGRQIRSKMRLLGNRMAPDLDYGVFAETDVSKVWSALYDYRSALAHGGSPSFTTGKLEKLRDEQTVIAFLQTACRRLLRQAVVEPLLCTDLKDC